MLNFRVRVYYKNQAVPGHNNKTALRYGMYARTIRYLSLKGLCHEMNNFVQGLKNKISTGTCIFLDNEDVKKI